MTSDTKTVLSIFGTRPEAIKMAPVVKALEETVGIESKVLVTAQHREMLDQVLELFRIEPDYDLNVMKANQDLFDITARILLELRDALDQCRPDLVLVHGDTTTCFSAALAAFYKSIPVGHVEAGLRTGDLSAPFPEEANRSLVGRLARLHFAPTASSKRNLLAENTSEDAIFVTGNTVIDALLTVQKSVGDYVASDWKSIPTPTVDALNASPDRMILITGHRRENFGQGFINFCEALKRIANHNPQWLLIYPVHLNPNVQKPVYELLSDCPNIHLIKPQDYLPFVWLLDKCDLVITDSGGIQEEAPSLGKPVLVTREVTERPEAVEAGTVLLVGTDIEKISGNAIDILENEERYQTMSKAQNPYGDGLAASRIIAAIQDFFAGN